LRGKVLETRHIYLIMRSITFPSILVVLIVLPPRLIVAGCGDGTHGVRYSFTEVVREAIVERDMDVAEVFEMLTLFRPRSVTLNCERPFEPREWPSSEIPYFIQPGFSPTATDRILSDLKQVNSSTCLTMVPHTTQGHVKKLQYFIPAPVITCSASANNPLYEKIS